MNINNNKIISALQWTVFIIAANLIPPLAVAASFGLSSQDTMLFLQRTIFVLGLAGLLQGLFGHKLPINEGPAGVWWGVFSLYAGLSQTLFSNNNTTLRVLMFSLILCGIISIALSLFGILEKVLAFFTPRVVGTYLILLVIQLSGGFLKGMLGIGYISNNVSITIMLISLFLILLSIYVSKTKKLASFTVIIVIVVGWLLFYMFGLTKPIPKVLGIFKIPGIFVFGMPKFDLSIIPTIFLVTLLLLTNMLASIQVLKYVVGTIENKEKHSNIKNSGIVMGINEILSGIFSAIGPVPISGSAGFVSQTKITSMKAFLLSNVFVILLSMCSPLIAFFSTLPTPVGYASIFIIFANMIGIAIQEFDKVEIREKIYKKVGIPIFIGAGLMFASSESFSGLPPTIISLLSNGLVVGTVIALIIEIIDKKR